MTHDTEKGFYLGLMVALVFVAIFCTMSGCATTRQSVDIRCEVPQDGKPVAVVAYSLVTK